MVYNEQDMKRLSVIFCVAMLLGSSACVFNESGVGPMDDTDAGNTNTDTNANTNTNANINANTNDNTNQSPELCADGAVSGDETDVDCGGSCPAGCAAGEGCSGPSDCQSLVCDGTTCADPTCSDGVTNGDETDMDCGGSCPTGCAAGEGCSGPSDCQSLVCDGSTCALPTCSDGTHNGDELDVDCGGTCPLGCARIFESDGDTLAILELNGDLSDSSGNVRHAVALSGNFVPTFWGQGLPLQGAAPQGIDWSSYAGLLVHPYTIEIVLVPNDTACYRRIFSFSANSNYGWYYCNGFVAYPNGSIGNTFEAQVRHYLAMVSTAPDAIDLYVNGALVDSTNAAFTAPPTDVLFFQDDNANGSQFLAGTVDAIRLSSVARTPSEILAIQQRLDLQPHLP